MDIHVQHTVVSFLHVTCLHLPGEIPKIVALLLEGILRLLSFPLLPVESLSTKICSEIKDVLNGVYSVFVLRKNVLRCLMSSPQKSTDPIHWLSLHSSLHVFDPE